MKKCVTKHNKIRWLLVFYDFVIALLSSLLFFIVYPLVTKNSNFEPSTWVQFAYHFFLLLIISFSLRFLFKVYSQIWRYGGITSYIRLLFSDFISTVLNIGFEFALSTLPFFKHTSVLITISCCFTFLLFSICIRMFYRFSYRYLAKDNRLGKAIVKLVKFFGATDLDTIKIEKHGKINIAIVGAGRTGTALAEELLSNTNSNYLPKFFVETSKGKSGRFIYDIPVIDENDLTQEIIQRFCIKEIVFALPNLSSTDKSSLYSQYKKYGCKFKIYDYPFLSSSGKKTLRDFDIEELLFRKTISIDTGDYKKYYEGKSILITGGGGSIGSELARQISEMSPKSLILLDIYENGVYDIQQELRIKHKDELSLFIEICSITNLASLEKVFNKYDIDIVIHAAAHKHVPLMEHNVIEAIENNVFGTDNILKMVEKYRVGRFMLVSTDKAVNPTNVMGATKRLCEINTFSHSVVSDKTIYTATRFGNVLGSAGSVIPLFKKQISSGGPITLTHKEIIRYFMTIPEASSLVLSSGAMGKNGELYVLDMGKPVKIYDLAETMIVLSGLVPGKDIEIVETGLRPGEKLFEELLMNSETLEKTSNDLIYIEKDLPLSLDDVYKKLNSLSIAIESGDDDIAKEALKDAVPTYVEKMN